MAAATSPTTSRRYGVARVCQVWDLPRSSFYAARQQQADTAVPPAPARRRGPKPVVSDEALLAAIRADLARTPWTGEGHRKVWAELAERFRRRSRWNGQRRGGCGCWMASGSRASGCCG
jgi:putative transposase